MAGERKRGRGRGHLVYPKSTHAKDETLIDDRRAKRNITDLKKRTTRL